MTYLPFDYARCQGKPAGPQGLNFPEECKDCLRRTSAWGDRQAVMLPPSETPCPERITLEQWWVKQGLPVEMMGN